jgi:uncharacterized membrane protein
MVTVFGDMRPPLKVFKPTASCRMTARTAVRAWSKAVLIGFTPVIIAQAVIAILKLTMATLPLRLPKQFRPLFLALLAANAVSLMLFISRVIDAQNFRYWFLLWNLVLAWVPLLLALLIQHFLQRHHWLSWSGLLLTGLWLGFLPNSFYLVSDLIHLQSTADINLLYDAVMFASFIFNAYIVGLISMVLIHRQLLLRIKRASAHRLMGLVIVLCGFAIYLGRSLRWNTWDAIVNPFGLIFDISERFINPLSHIQSYMTTATFSLLIGGLYLVTYQLGKLILPAAKAGRK